MRDCNGRACTGLEDDDEQEACYHEYEVSPHGFVVRVRQNGDLPDDERDAYDENVDDEHEEAIAYLARKE